MTFTVDSIIADVESLTLGGRSLQQEIGVSEIGMDCRRCVARKLAKLPKQKVISSFRTTVGRAFHALMEEELPALHPDEVSRGQLLIEQKLFIHRYKSLLLMGSCDLFAVNDGEGMVWDWKLVGDDTLDEMRRRKAKGLGPKEQYRIQGMTYGLGWRLRGYGVKKVVIFYAPANKGNLARDCVYFEMEYDESVALAALARIEALIDEAEIDGWDAVIRRQEPASGCLSCRQYMHVDNPVYDMVGAFGRKSR